MNLNIIKRIYYTNYHRMNCPSLFNFSAALFYIFGRHLCTFLLLLNFILFIFSIIIVIICGEIKPPLPSLSLPFLFEHPSP
ncbi:hypothetical protein BDC45DRAFT_600548 [Circinella umbellata]|nr:hypothetical protein BDC45DRAFT_600548 [Circinella umbellata]